MQLKILTNKLENPQIGFFPVFFIILFLFSGCLKKQDSQDIEDCDNIANYYEDGEHYIRRDLVTDEGVLDRKKLFEDTINGKSECYPVKSYGRLKK